MPYSYEEVQEGEEMDIDKSLYADDSTTYQGSDEGAQELVDGLSDFSAAVGIVIKPSKTTWNKTEDFTLGEPTRTELEDITTQHVHRLGNTQRMDGSSKKTV